MMQIIAVNTGTGTAGIDRIKYQAAKRAKGTGMSSFSEMLSSKMQGADAVYTDETIEKDPGYDDMEMCMEQALWLEAGEGTKGEGEGGGTGEARASAEPGMDEVEQEQPMVLPGVPILFFSQPQEVSRPPRAEAEPFDKRSGRIAGNITVLPTAIASEGAMDGAITTIKQENEIHGTASGGYKAGLGPGEETAGVQDSPVDMEQQGLSQTDNTNFMDMLNEMKHEEMKPNAGQPSDIADVQRSFGEKWPLGDNPVETLMSGEVKEHEKLPAAAGRDKGLSAIRSYQRDQDRWSASDQNILPLNSNLEPGDATAAVQGTESPERAEPAASVAEQIIDRISLSKREGRTELTVQLKPDSMGTVSVRLTSENGLTMAKIITDRPETKELIEGQLLALKQQLGDRGIDVKELDIVYAGAGFMKQQPDTGRDRGGREPALSHRFYSRQQKGVDEPAARIAPGELTIAGRINYLV